MACSSTDPAAIWWSQAGRSARQPSQATLRRCESSRGVVPGSPLATCRFRHASGEASDGPAGATPRTRTTSPRRSGGAYQASRTCGDAGHRARARSRRSVGPRRGSSAAPFSRVKLLATTSRALEAQRADARSPVPVRPGGRGALLTTARPDLSCRGYHAAAHPRCSSTCRGVAIWTPGGAGLFTPREQAVHRLFDIRGTHRKVIASQVRAMVRLTGFWTDAAALAKAPRCRRRAPSPRSSDPFGGLAGQLRTQSGA